MSAMLKDTASALGSTGMTSNGLTGANNISTVPGSLLPGSSALPGGGNMVQSMEQLQEKMVSMNVYMLGLQQSFHDMNQKYSAVSNMLKTKHDTEKNTISNLR